jgi:hypothetical protein
MLHDFKISFYVNSHADKLFEKWKRISYFITMGVIVWRNDDVKRQWKGMTTTDSSDGMVLWLERRQNIDAVEWWGEWPSLRWYFYSSGGWDSNSLGRVASGGGVNSMIQFQLEGEGDGMKCCRMIKQKQQAHLDFIGKKRYTTQ